MLIYQGCSAFQRRQKIWFDNIHFLNGRFLYYTIQRFWETFQDEIIESGAPSFFMAGAV